MCKSASTSHLRGPAQTRTHALRNGKPPTAHTTNMPKQKRTLCSQPHTKMVATCPAAHPRAGQLRPIEGAHKARATHPHPQGLLASMQAQMHTDAQQIDEIYASPPSM